MSPAERETPAGEAMREAVAAPEVQKFEVTGDDGCIIYFAGSAWFCFEAEVTAYQAWAASELARLTAERDEANTEIDRLRTVQNFDRRQLRVAKAALTTLRADHAAEVARKDAEIARLRKALTGISADERLSWLGGSRWDLAPSPAAKIASAALATTETTDA